MLTKSAIESQDFLVLWAEETRSKKFGSRAVIVPNGSLASFESKKQNEVLLLKNTLELKQIKTHKASYGFLRRFLALCRMAKKKFFSASLQLVVSAVIVFVWVENPMIPQGGRQQKLIRIYLLTASFSFSLCLSPTSARCFRPLCYEIEQKSSANLWFFFKSLSL